MDTCINKAQSRPVELLDENFHYLERFIAPIVVSMLSEKEATQNKSGHGAFLLNSSSNPDGCRWTNPEFF